MIPTIPRHGHGFQMILLLLLLLLPAVVGRRGSHVEIEVVGQAVSTCLIAILRYSFTKPGVKQLLFPSFKQ